MDDVVRVRCCQTGSDAGEEPDGFANRKRSVGDLSGQCAAVVIGHHDKELAVGALFKPVDSADIRVIERGNRACFPEQALFVRFTAVEGLWKKFERDDTVE